MTRVGEQRHGIGDEAEHRLRRDEGKIQPDADRKSPAEILWRVRMAVTVVVRIVRMIMNVAVRSVGHTRDLAEAAAQRQAARPGDLR